MLRSALLALTTATTVGLAGLVTAPAEAVPTTTVTVDTSRPGHVSGTVTTDAPYAYASVTGTPTPQPVTDGALDYDLLTWGAPTDRATTLVVGACADQTLSGCTVTETPFTAHDVDPQLDWREDRYVGVGEVAEVTVTDHPDGGGELRAASSRPSTENPVLSEGANTLSLPDGTNDVTVSRCGPVGCRPVATETFQVDRHFSPQPRGSIAPVRPDRTSAPDATVGFEVEGSDRYDVTWYLRDPDTGDRVRGTRGQLDDVSPDGVVLRLPIDLTPAPEGRSELVATISYDSEHFGHRSATTVNPYLPVVDRTAPLLGEPLVFGRHFFPRRGTGPAQLEVGADAYAEWTRLRMRIVDPGSGRTVFSSTTSGRDFLDHIWDGRTDEGRRVPSGRYRIRLTATDVVGNQRSLGAGRTTVDWRRR